MSDRYSPLQKVWLIVQVVQARLRFLVILALVAFVMLSWDRLAAWWAKWTRPAAAQTGAQPDTEFYCPMHPQILRARPDKCPICGMPLSRRKKGEHGDEPLPPGVISRVQLSPYRVALAGIRTVPVEYQPLQRAIQTIGFVEFDERKLARIAARVSGRNRIDKLYVNVTGQKVNKGDELALLYSPDLVTTVQNLLDAQRLGNRELLNTASDRLRLWGIEEDQVQELMKTGKPITHVRIRSPISGHVLRKYPVEGEYVEEGARLYDVVDLATVWVQAQVYEQDMGLLREGLTVHAATAAFPDRVFTGQTAFIHPHVDRASRTLTVRFDMDNPNHDLRPGMYATVQLQVPITQMEVFESTLRKSWALGTAMEQAVHALLAPAGPVGALTLDPFVLAAVREAAYRQGMVLAVPENAVIDTGNRKIVYREAEPGVYEGVEVALGPRCGTFYPVIRGLAGGERIATAGSFLIDAETRLNPAAGSTYFGASGGPREERSSAATARPSMAEDENLKIKAALARLSPADRALAEAQGFCAAEEDNRLGAMGTPIKIILRGQPVFLCCKGCEDAAKANPDQTLDRVTKLKARPRANQR